MLTVLKFVVSDFAQNCRVIFNPSTLNAIVVDPGAEAVYLYKKIISLNLNVKAILLTHGHHDHCGAATELSELLNVEIVGPCIEDSAWLLHLKEQSQMFHLNEAPNVTNNRFVTDNEELDLDLGEKIKVLACPGHTPGHACYYFKDSNMLLSGDVLFAGSVGRSDFPMGNHHDLIDSIKNKLLVLPDDTQVLTGHGGETTIKYEKKYNPFLNDD